MSGLINTGLDYKRSAMSGLARLSDEERQREATNEQIKNAETAQAVQMGATAGGLILALALL